MEVIMNAKKKFDFISYLTNEAGTEEDVKYAYVNRFKIEFSTKNKNDLRTDGILFEFKYDKPMRKGVELAKIIAQSFYYVHRCLYGQVMASVPKYIVLADKNEAAIILSDTWKELFTPLTYDWRRAPSSPDQKLIDAVEDHPEFKNIKVYDLTQSQEYGFFATSLENALKDEDILITPGFVTLENFEEVFVHWKSMIGQHLPQEAEQKSRHRLAVYFMNDLQKQSRYSDEDGVLTFSKLGGIEFKIPARIYRGFWKMYKRPPETKDMGAILARTDRLENMDKRRFQGDFFTPLPFAKLGLEYITKVLGEDWYKEYYVWDMACGTGNLEYHIPSYENVFMSTIDTGEVSYLQGNNMFPGATIFQYDYLNDDVELVMLGADLLDDKLGWKLPRKLREALADKSKKWVVLINPPYAEATAGIACGANKAGTSGTQIKAVMSQVDLGKAGNELFVQFMYRIHREFPQGVHLGVYAKLKYVNSQAFEPFRDKVFQPEYKTGYIFPASAFQGTKGEWPVSFLIWDWSKKIQLESQKIEMDVYDYDKEE
jgi:hypothetical protein